MSKDEHVKQFELALKNVKYDVIGLCEVKRENEEIMERNDFILYSNTISRKRGSVGILVKRIWKENIKMFKCLSDRVCYVKLSFKNETLIIIQGYAPHSGRSDQEVDDFYNDLSKAINETSNATWQIIMGDFNAKIGKPTNIDYDVMGRHGYGDRNKRGKILIDFARSQELFIANTIHKKKDQRKFTWNMNNTYNEIDFIMTRNNQKSMIQNVEVLNKFEYSSDHRMVRSTINLKWKTKFVTMSKFKPRIIIPDDENEIQKYQTELLKNFQDKAANNEVKGHEDKNANNEVKGHNESIDIQRNYNEFVDCLMSATDIIRKKKPQDKIISEKTKELIIEREKLLKLKHNDKSYEKEFKKMRNNVNKMIQKDIRKHELNELQYAIDNNKTWKKIKNGIYKSTNWIPKLKNKNGEMKFMRDEILEIATNFYEELYSSQISVEEKETLMPILDETSTVNKITVDEIQTALSMLKNGRAIGDDEISVELLKISESAIYEIQKIFNDILENEEIPSQWLKSTISLIYKKGDKSDIKNYRPITKTSQMYKLFAKVILNRISSTLEKHQTVNQAGFRNGFSTIDHIFTIQQITEKCYEYDLPIFLGFIDYNKAFDSIEHPFLWQALKEQNVNHKYIIIIKKIYENSTACLKLDKEGRQFKINRGIKQGCCISPNEFNSAIQKIFNNIKWNGSGLRIGNESLNELRFADDVVIISQTKEELEVSMMKVLEESEKAGLTINVEKTKIMTNTKETNFMVNGKNIETVEEYKYLGRLISFNKNSEKEIDTRIANAWKSFWSLKRFFKGNFPIYHKRRLMNTCILPILTYGSQCWGLTDEEKCKLSITQRKMERSFLNKRTDEISNVQLRKKTKIIDVIKFSKQQKWNYTGHMMRETDGRWTKKIEKWVPNKQRRKGRPRMKWIDEIYEFDNNFRRNAMFRDRWKKKGESFVL